MSCNRFGNFGKDEMHICFQCLDQFSPGKNKTCEKCNWKLCNHGHCGCTVSKETKEVLDKFYDLLCEPHNYSKETKRALFEMVNIFHKYCMGCLK